MPPRKDPNGPERKGYKLRQLTPDEKTYEQRLKGKRPSTPKGLKKVGENRFKLKTQAARQVKKSAPS